MNAFACLLPVSAHDAQSSSPVQASLLWQPGHRKHLGLRGATQDSVEEGRTRLRGGGHIGIPQISRH